MLLLYFSSRISPRHIYNAVFFLLSSSRLRLLYWFLYISQAAFVIVVRIPLRFHYECYCCVWLICLHISADHAIKCGAHRLVSFFCVFYLLPSCSRDGTQMTQFMSNAFCKTKFYISMIESNRNSSIDNWKSVRWSASSSYFPAVFLLLCFTVFIAHHCNS